MTNKGDSYRKRYGRRKVRLIRTSLGEIRIMFSYEPNLKDMIKSLEGHRFDRVYQWWTLPDTETNRVMVEMFCREQGWRYVEIDDRKRKVVI